MYIKKSHKLRPARSTSVGRYSGVGGGTHSDHSTRPHTRATVRDHTQVEKGEVEGCARDQARAPAHKDAQPLRSEARCGTVPVRCQHTVRTQTKFALPYPPTNSVHTPPTEVRDCLGQRHPSARGGLAVCVASLSALEPQPALETRAPRPGVPEYWPVQAHSRCVPPPSLPATFPPRESLSRCAENQPRLN